MCRVGWSAPCDSSTRNVLRCVRGGVGLQHRAELLLSDFSFLYTQSCNSKCQWFLRLPLPLNGLKLLGKTLNSKGRETGKFGVFKQLLPVCGFRNKTESDGPFLASPPVLGLYFDISFWFFGFFFLHVPYETKESGKKLLPLKCYSSVSWNKET